mgnify:FL=1
MNNPGYPPLRLSWLVWGLGALFYVIAFFQRVAPAVLTTELMSDFALTATTLGNLSAFYFYSYVAMQVPTGLLADHWGPRRLLTLGAAVAGLGTLMFGMAPDALWANAGRLLIGGSVAVAFVSMLKLASHWMPPRQFALASGLALFCGIIGAVFAGVPLRLLVDAFGWRPVMIVTAVITFTIGIIIWLLVRDDPIDKGYLSHAADIDNEGISASGNAMAGIKEVLNYRNTWLLSLIPGGVAGSAITFAGLWGVPFLASHYGMQKTAAAAVCSTLLISWAVGGPVFGWLSDHLGHRKPLYALGCVILLCGWSIILLAPELPIPLLVALLIVVGFASGNMIIGFAYAKESVPAYLSGTVSGVINMGVMMGPMLLQPAVGWMLDRAWDGDTMDGVRIYSLEAYRDGFLLMLAWLALAMLLVLFTRETDCNQFK